MTIENNNLEIESVTTALGRLHAACVVSRRFNVPVNIINDLARDGFMPHYRVKGVDQPLFHAQESKDWIIANLIERVEGRKLLPPVLKVVLEPLAAAPMCLPPALAAISGLKELDLDGFCGIYFLCLGSEVVYVGQSIVVPSRVLSHRKEKECDRALFLRTPESDLNEVERRFIELLNPKLNKAFSNQYGESRKTTAPQTEAHVA
jgi:hypothetical protein